MFYTVAVLKKKYIIKNVNINIFFDIHCLKFLSALVISKSLPSSQFSISLYILSCVINIIYYLFCIRQTVKKNILLVTSVEATQAASLLSKLCVFSINVFWFTQICLENLMETAVIWKDFPWYTSKFVRSLDLQMHILAGGKSFVK